MRRRYIEINDYNRNLFGTLKSRADIRIVRLEQDVIGWQKPLADRIGARWTIRAEDRSPGQPKVWRPA